MEIAAETNRFLESAPALPLLPASQSSWLRWGDRAQGAVEEQEGLPGPGVRPAPLTSWGNGGLGLVLVLVLAPVSGWKSQQSWFGRQESPLPQAWQLPQGGRAPDIPGQPPTIQSPHQSVWGPEKNLP